MKEKKFISVAELGRAWDVLCDISVNKDFTRLAGHDNALGDTRVGASYPENLKNGKKRF